MMNEINPNTRPRRDTFPSIYKKFWKYDFSKSDDKVRNGHDLKVTTTLES